MTIFQFIKFVPVLALVAGCSFFRPLPLKPGASRITSGVGTNGVVSFSSDMKQPENPAQGASQNYERTTETEMTLEAGTKVTEGGKEIVLAKPTVQKTRVTEKAGTVIGAAQKDVAREMAAKLSSLKGLVWVGMFLFVFGIASAVYPPLKIVTGGSMTTSAAITAGGLALMVLPSLVVGHELLILGGVVLGVGGWFLAHRHGKLQGVVDSVMGKVTGKTPSTNIQAPEKSQAPIPEVQPLASTVTPESPAPVVNPS